MLFQVNVYCMGGRQEKVEKETRCIDDESCNKRVTTEYLKIQKSKKILNVDIPDIKIWIFLILTTLVCKCHGTPVIFIYIIPSELAQLNCGLLTPSVSDCFSPIRTSETSWKEAKPSVHVVKTPDFREKASDASLSGGWEILSGLIFYLQERGIE